MTENNLIDAWRIHHPDKKQFTWHLSRSADFTSCMIAITNNNHLTSKLVILFKYLKFKVF